jgi:hypothetical protein
MDENTRPWYTIDELNAWADKYQNEQWHKAAIRLGEELASVGPVGYYEMDASEWFDWAVLKVRPRTWVGLTDEEIKAFDTWHDNREEEIGWVRQMIVRKVRGEDKIGKIILMRDEVEIARKMGISVEKYAATRLVQIAKKRKWKWFFKENK